MQNSCSYQRIKRILALRDPDGNITYYNYNPSTLRLSTIQHPYSGTTYYTYNSYGELIRIDYANGTFTEYAYDDLGRIDYVHNQNPEGFTISLFDYTYNADSNVTRVDVVRNFSGETFFKTYAYDALHRLTQEQKYPIEGGKPGELIYSYTYQYDAVGNRTQMINYNGSQTITTNYSYNSLNQLTQRVVNAGPDQGTWNYTYDNNGNMTLEKKGTVEKRYFSYNFDDRMIHVEVNYADIYGYEYDALGRRLISTDNNGNKTLYYYDGFQVIIEKTKPSGSSSWTTAKVYTLADESIGFIISERNSELGQDIWYHYDRLGNVMDITQDDGILYTFYEQDSFGIILEGVGEGYHLITKEYNYDIGLYYLNDRWYDPKFGRFTQIGVFSPVFEHPYVYAENAPTIYVDPTGFICYWVSKKKGPWKIKYNPWERDNRSDIKGGSSNVTISDPLPGTWTVAFCYWYFKRLVIKTRMVESTYNCWKRCKGFYKYSKTEEEQDVYWEHHTEITPAHLIPLGAYSRMGWMCSSGDLPLNWQKVQGGF